MKPDKSPASNRHMVVGLLFFAAGPVAINANLIDVLRRGITIESLAPNRQLQLSGLAFVQVVAAKHCGRISVLSKVSSATRFCLMLPFTNEPPVENGIGVGLK